LQRSQHFAQFVAFAKNRIKNFIIHIFQVKRNDKLSFQFCQRSQTYSP